MSSHFNDFLGRGPLPYVRREMRRHNFLTPPISVEAIADGLGLKIEERDPPKETGDSSLHEVFMTTSAWLVREQKTIGVYKGAPRKRKRISVGHENTHFMCPTHAGIDPFCPDSDDPTIRKHTEREAFLGAAAQVFYPKLFMPDMLSFQSFGLNVLDHLSDRYDASLEATANCYAIRHPGRCAILVAGIADPPPPQNTHNGDGALVSTVGQSSKPSPIWTPRNGDYHVNGTSHTIEVLYCIASERFPDWIPSGRKIPDTSVIFRAYNSNLTLPGEVIGTDFGSSSPQRYQAECRAFQANGKPAVMVLLWQIDRQLDLPISSPYDGW